MEQKRMTEFLNREYEIRDRFMMVLRKNPPESFMSLAKEMKVNLQTLRNFMDDKTDASFLTLLRVEKWCNDQSFKEQTNSRLSQ